MITTIDWCGFRTQDEIPACIEALRACFYPMGDLLTIRPRKSGWMGYTQSSDVCLADMVVGLMAYGGEGQRGWVSVNITGRGCEYIQDWVMADQVLHSLLRFEFRRVDIALTTWKREVTHDIVVAAHAAGQFKGGGKPPEMSMHTSSDPLAGKTVYIGARTSGKYLRCYEKGFEMVKGRASGMNITQIKIDGLGFIPIQDGYRVELELKAKTGLLPVDLIARRDDYFAGAYPFTASLLSAKPQVFSQSKERGPQRDLELALDNIRHQYGSTFFTALAAYHGDMGAVLQKVVGVRHNDVLLEAGVLLVDHG